MPVVSALKNCYVWGFLEVPADILDHCWIQVAASILKPPHETAATASKVKQLQIYNGHVHATAILQRTQLSVRV
jgi:hypothetical protein